MCSVPSLVMYVFWWAVFCAGGQTLADAMAFNYKIRELCIVDNKVGFDVMTLLAARLRGTAGETGHCVRATELDIPSIHLEKRVRAAKP